MIFDKASLGGVEINNRIIRSATHDGLADENGAPTEKLIKKYAYLAKNDVGCIITGYAGVSENGMSPYPAMLKIHNDENLGAFKRLADAVHEQGAPVVLQIAHCGRQTSSKAIGKQKVAPTSKMHLFYPDKAKELEESEIRAIINDFVSASIRAEKCGFDAVQLHSGHGYLLHDFISPYGNNRTDAWGGTTENRARIIVEIIKGIKANTKLPVWIKLSAEDNRKNGMNVDEAIKVCKILERAGIDAIEVSCGTVEDGMNTMRSKAMPMKAVFKYREPCASFPKPLKVVSLACAEAVNPLLKQPTPLENFNVANAEKIKASVNVPIIVVGGIHRLDDMKSIVSTGKADAISMCRPFICEPNLARKLKEGKQSEAKCIMCNFCGLVIEKGETKCLYGQIKD